MANTTWQVAERVGGWACADDACADPVCGDAAAPGSQFSMLSG